MEEDQAISTKEIRIKHAGFTKKKQVLGSVSSPALATNER
jgi:hypothetical protein